MPGVLDFLPLFQESAASIRARMDADANAGLAEDDPRYVDTREGTFYYDLTQVALLEIARLWDGLSVEVPAAAFPLFAWGDYLDAHAEQFGLERKVAVPASGTVNFAGEPGTVVASGTVVSADAPTEDAEAIEFAVQEAGTIGSQLAAPTGLAGTPATTGGTLATGSYAYRVTAVSQFGETDGSDEVTVAVTGPSGRVALDWNDVAGAVEYRLYRMAPGDGIGQRIYAGGASSFNDTGGSSALLGPPDSNLSAGVALAVEALLAGSEGNVSTGAITNLDTPNPGVDDVRNPFPTTGGEDTETDESLRERVLFTFTGQGGGNANDYRRWSLERPGVGKVFVEPVWQGAGTVHVVVMQADGSPVAAGVLSDVQQYLDPVPGQGAGRAPVGVTVTVSTPTIRIMNIAATLTFTDGFNLDGGGGLVGVRADIERALADYIDSLTVGEDVIYRHVLGQFFRVRGVHDVPTLTVNGGTTDVAVPAVPPEIAKLGSVALS